MPDEQLDIAAIETMSDTDWVAHKTTMGSFRNVFDAVVRDGHDVNFVPMACDSFVPTDLVRGAKLNC